MLRNIIDTFKEVVRKNKLSKYEKKLRKLDNARSRLKSKAMIIQREYDTFRGMT